MAETATRAPDLPVVDVAASDLPVFCPNPGMPLWNALPARRRSEGRPLSRPLPSTHSGIHSANDRVLLIAPSWVGDAILSEPLVAGLHDTGVTQAIDVVAPPWCGPIY